MSRTTRQTTPSLPRAYIQAWLKDNIGRNAAAIAYYTVFSLPAMLLIVLRVAEWIIGGNSVSEEFFSRVSVYAGPRMAEVLRQAVENMRSDTPDSWTGWIGAILLLVATIGVIRQVRIAVNIIMHMPAKRGGILSQLWTAILTLILIVLTAVLILASVIAASILSVIGRNVTDILQINVDILSAAGIGISYVLLSGIFFLLYWLLPRARYPLDIVAISACASGALLMAGTTLLSAYISRSNLGYAYGVAASLLVLLFWIYYSAIAFLSGAELIDVLSRRRGFNPAKAASPAGRLHGVQSALKKGIQKIGSRK